MQNQESLNGGHGELAAKAGGIVSVEWGMVLGCEFVWWDEALV